MLKTTESRSDPCIVVLGDKDEETEIKVMAGFKSTLTEFGSDELLFGAPALSAVLEKRMIQHLKAQLPRMLEAIDNEIAATEAELKTIELRPPIQEMLKATEVIKGAFNEGYHYRETELRKMREKMCECIKGLELFETGEQEWTAVNDLDELFEGQRARFLKDRFWSKEHRIVKVAKDSKTVLLQCVLDGGRSDPECVSVQRSSLEIVLPSQASAVNAIQLLTDKGRGLRNTSHSDPQPIIERFMEPWAVKVAQVMRETAANMCKLATEQAIVAFKNARVPVAASEAVLGLLEVYKRHIVSLNASAISGIDRIESFNKPPLVFTTNDHYLESIFKHFVAKENTESTLPTDESSAKILYFRVKAYHKVQTKLVSEAASKELIGLWTTQLNAGLNEVLAFAETEEFVNLIKQPVGRERRRAELQAALISLKDVSKKMATL